MINKFVRKMLKVLLVLSFWPATVLNAGKLSDIEIGNARLQKMNNESLYSIELHNRPSEGESEKTLLNEWFNNEGYIYELLDKTQGILLNADSARGRQLNLGQTSNDGMQSSYAERRPQFPPSIEFREASEFFRSAGTLEISRKNILGILKNIELGNNNEPTTLQATTTTDTTTTTEENTSTKDTITTTEDIITTTEDITTTTEYTTTEDTTNTTEDTITTTEEITITEYTTSVQERETTPIETASRITLKIGGIFSNSSEVKIAPVSNFKGYAWRISLSLTFIIASFAVVIGVTMFCINVKKTKNDRYYEVQLQNFSQLEAGSATSVINE